MADEDEEEIKIPDGFKERLSEVITLMRTAGVDGEEVMAIASDMLRQHSETDTYTLFTAAITIAWSILERDGSETPTLGGLPS